MKSANTDASHRITQDWHPSYWLKETHGFAWEKVKAALERDWEQTKNEIPARGAQNPAANSPIWAEAEIGVRYGYGAHQQHGKQHEKWSDKLEVQLSTEWDEEKTGKPFSAVRPYVRHGWNWKP